jgi:DNA-binding transcriptional LysR family regulator
VPTGCDLSWVPLGREPVRLVLPPAGQRAGRGVTWQLPTSRGSPAATAAAPIWSTCASRRVRPQIRHVTDDYVVVQNLVAAGLGVALLPLRPGRLPHPEIDVARCGRRRTATSGLIHRAGAETVPAVRPCSRRWSSATPKRTAIRTERGSERRYFRVTWLSRLRLWRTFSLTTAPGRPTTR